MTWRDLLAHANPIFPLLSSAVEAPLFRQWRWRVVVEVSSLKWSGLEWRGFVRMCMDVQVVHAYMWISPYCVTLKCYNDMIHLRACNYVVLQGRSSSRFILGL